LVGSALKDIGVTQLLDAITAYMPSAEDARVTATNANGDEIEVVPGETPGLVARVFKTLADPYVGRMTMFRVYSGTVKSDSTVYNVTRGREERVGQLFFLRGKEQIQTDAVGPGDIGVIAKLQETQTGDSLTTRDQALSLPGLELPSPTVTMAARPMEKGDEDKVFTGLTKLIEEDPTLHLERHPVTGENLVSGLGELHLEVMSARLQKKFGANVELAVPRVPYKETLRKKAHAEYRHKKQTGGRGQYG